ncbi:MAG: hypothetical protein M3Y42_15530 [Actinomycetota bacterium]|nr:hypothetical protein [Actinomycetota bacterium]
MRAQTVEDLATVCALAKLGAPATSMAVTATGYSGPAGPLPRTSSFNCPARLGAALVDLAETGTPEAAQQVKEAYEFGLVVLGPPTDS